MRNIYLIVAFILFMIIEIVTARSASEWGAGELAESQRNATRVINARTNCADTIDSIFNSLNIEYPAKIFLRIFKYERKIEMWAYSAADTKYVFLKEYPFTSFSGNPGPKRREGDWQIPEGFYIVYDFNPVSNFHLSLKINYPNQSDRILGDSQKPGGEIRIHGSNVTIGCIPIGDEAIEELYVIALDSRDVGFDINVHIFPYNFVDSLSANSVKSYAKSDSSLSAFWTNLREGYDYFEKLSRLPKITVDANGKYIFE